MRENELFGLRLPPLWTIALVVAAGLALSSFPVRAADDDDEPIRDDSFMSNIMRGLGGTNGSNGIEYRERSPLVVPRQLTLPTPQSRRSEGANWPKDPDVQERRAAREAQKNYDWRKDINPRPLLPSELDPPGIARARSAISSPQPGAREEIPRPSDTTKLLPSQLGYTGGLFNVFGKKSVDEEKFISEPSRDSLTQPPPGYQTPSPSFAYGADSKPLPK